jgi:FkbM family methyltransferase
LAVIQDLIYDIGSNNGDDAAYYLSRGFRVLCIEADPALCRDLEARFGSDITAGRLSVLNAALGSARATVDFWVCEGKSVWNSFDRAVATRDGRTATRVEIEAFPMGELFARYGVPHYVKLSLHGHEHFCLQDIHPPAAPTYLSLELPRDSATSGAVFDRLAALGYERVKVIEQTTLTPLAMPSPPTLKERVKSVLGTVPPLLSLAQAVNRVRQAATGTVPEPYTGVRTVGGYAFQEGCSGPFGEETPGPWLTVADSRQDYLAYLQAVGSDEHPNLSIWHDVHARRPA